MHEKMTFSPLKVTFTFLKVIFSSLKVTFRNVMTFPDFTRHFFSSLADSIDVFVIVVLNR